MEGRVRGSGGGDGLRAEAKGRVGRGGILLGAVSCVSQLVTSSDSYGLLSFLCLCGRLGRGYTF